MSAFQCPNVIFCIFCLLCSGNIKKTLALVSQTADSICDGDLVERLIRQKGNWSMLPMQVLNREMKVKSCLIH